MKNRPRHICRGRFFIRKAPFLRIAAPPDGSPSLSLRVGSCTMIFKQYEPVPKNIASEVVEKRIKEGKVRPMAD